MLTQIIGFSIRNKLIVGLFVLALIGYGAYQATKLPIDAVPDITDNQVQIITVAPSFGATDIERLVTFPVEQSTSNISGLKESRSFSRSGLSLVTLVFEDETDVYWARQQVAERLQQVQAQIPKGIGTPEMGPVTTGLGEIYQYVVRAKPGFEKKYDATELRTIQDWIIRRQLLNVKGVAEVSSFGGKLKQYEVAVNPARLHAAGITITDVFTALEKSNQNTGGAYIEKGPSVLFIRSEGLIGSKADIENSFIRTGENGIPLFIRDVADVKIGEATRYGALCYNDEGEATGAIVMMLKGANSSEVIGNVKERIELIRKTLPEGVVIEPFLDRTKMVNNAISTVETNLLEGALIVVLILVLFLGNLRAGLLVASVIPLAMLFAIILMNIFGVSGNLMSLGALDFGIIVDGAVIIVEAVMHQLTHSKKFRETNLLTAQQMDSTVLDSASKMMNSAVFGQLIILIVYLPIFTLRGIEGKMFKPMAETVAFALLGAFVLSLTYIPMMSALFLSKKVKHKPGLSDRVMFRIERVYQAALSRILKIPKTAMLITVSLFAFSVFVFTTLGGEFIPQLEEGDFAVDTRVLTGSSLKTTIKHTQQAAHILKTRFPEVEKIVTKIGSGEVPTDPMPMEASDMMVILKPKSEWTSAETFDELAEKMGATLRDVPGITAGFQYPVQMRFNELMTGARQDVVCKIFGENLDTLARYAEKLGKLVNQVKGSKNLYVEPVTGLPQLIIEPNRAALARYNVTVEDVNTVINTAMAGKSAGQVFEGEKHFELVVRIDTASRKSPDDLRSLLIPGPGGQQIPITQLCSITIKDGPNQVQREDAKRRIVVGFNVGNRDVQSIVNELQLLADSKLKLPPGYYVTYGGAFENLVEARKRLSVAVPVSLLLIFILLYFAFRSVRQGLLIYTAIPLSAIGGILFLAMRQMPFSISAGVGFIALFGVAVLNGIVLLAEFNRLKKGGLTDLSRIVLMGTKVRLRPVLMTACVASLGFLPMALSNGAGAEVQRPLATVVIGGLLIATFLTLFILPVLYVLFEKNTMKTVPPKAAAAVLLLVMLAGAAPANAQQISLQAAIDTALKNNRAVKNEKLVAAYQQQLLHTAADLPQTTLVAETGQLNSAYRDNRLGASQAFSIPVVYSRQKKVLQEKYRAALSGVALQENETRKAVTTCYYAVLLLREKEKLLLRTDSIYGNMQQRMNLRLEKGEASAPENATVRLLRGEAGLQLNQLRQEITLELLHLQLLLNSSIRYEPATAELHYSNAATADSTALQKHPQVLAAAGELKTALAYTRYEKSKLLPELSIGYYNMSMRGTGADNVTYDASARFSSVQAGVGIPLFFGAQQARIRAARVSAQAAENSYREVLEKLDYSYRSAQLQQRVAAAAVAYYEQQALPDAALLIESAGRRFASGELNYFEWSMLVNQALHVQAGYLDALNELNQQQITLRFLTIN